MDQTNIPQPENPELQRLMWAWAQWSNALRERGNQARATTDGPTNAILDQALTNTFSELTLAAGGRAEFIQILADFLATGQNADNNLQAMQQQIVNATEGAVSQDDFAEVGSNRSIELIESDNEESDDEEIVDGMQCGICMSRQINVQFKDCTHGACKVCVKGVWRSRKQHRGHFPQWIPCHECRAEVNSVGTLCQQVNIFGPVSKERPSFIVSEWAQVLEWVLKGSESARQEYRDME